MLPLTINLSCFPSTWAHVSLQKKNSARWLRCQNTETPYRHEAEVANFSLRTMIFFAPSFPFCNTFLVGNLSSKSDTQYVWNVYEQ